MKQLIDSISQTFLNDDRPASRAAKSGYCRWSLAGRLDVWLVVAMVLTIPFVLRSASLALGDRDNQIRQWLPGGFAETERYDWFVEHFGSEEFVLASWEGATLDDPRLGKLAEDLREVAADSVSSPADATSSAAWFREVRTGAELVEQLQAEPLSLSRTEAVRRLRGTLLGPDAQTTGLFVLLTERGRADRHGAVAAIYQTAEDHSISRDQLRLGGPTIESVALDQESERSRYQLTAIALLLGTAAAWRCLRDVRLVAVVMLIALYSGAATLAWIHVFGDKLNLVMVTMPTLVYVLTISGAIHITHYHADAVRRYGRRASAAKAIAVGWVPCVLTAVTTAIGLGSLVVSHVTPVRLFGFYSALGVLTSLPVVLCVLPVLLSWLPDRRAARAGGLADRSPGERDEQRGNNKVGAAQCRSIFRTGKRSVTAAKALAIERLGEWVTRWHMPITIVGIGLMVIGAMGLTRLTTSVKLTHFFSPQSRVIADYRWLESELAPLVPLEIVLRMRSDEQSRMVDRLAMAARVERAVAAIPEVKGIVSAATFAPAVPSGTGIRQVSRRAIINRRLEEQRESLMDRGYLRADGEDELWRVSVRVDALNDLDYGRFIDTVRAAVEPVLADHTAGAIGSSPQAIYTGVVPLIYKAQRVLLEDLTFSFVAAFGLIALVMVVLFRGPGAGLVSMLPNTFPAIVVFGGMGWLGEHCDIGSMITASVALGIAVDDTIHFLSWFRRGLAAGLARRSAILHAYRHCGVAMLQTTFICGLGMLAFAFSDFAPTARFATLMSTLLLAALLGDLLFLPALLASPAGRLFERRVQRSATPLRWPVVEDSLAKA